MRKNMQKVLSCFLAVFLLVTSFGTSFVFADDEFPVEFVLNTNENYVMAGDTFTVDFALDFDFDQMIIAEGIVVFRCNLNFDSDILDIIDPNTMAPIETDGSYFTFEDNGSADGFTAVMANDGETLVILYTASNDEDNIWNPGDIATFAFRAKNDLVIDNQLATNILIKNPDVAVQNSAITEKPVAGKTGVFITPPFKLSNKTSQVQGTTLRLTERCMIGADAIEPLMISIIDSEGNVIEEQQATVTPVRYDVSFLLDESLYAPGAYTIKYVYGTMTSTANFTVEEIVVDTPIVDVPTEPDNGDDNTDDGDNTNTDNNTQDKDDDKNGGGTGSVGGLVTNPDNKDEEEEPTKPVDKPVVVYPSDIANHWAAENVKYVYDNQLMNGYEDGTFGVENPITRAEFVTVMARLLGLEEDATSGADFGDCAGHWATGYIGALASKGIVGGVADGQFAPDDNITREQIAVILSRAFSLVGAAEENTFADDAQISSWAKAGVYAVLDAGYMQGDTDGNFAPLANATRGEVATVIMRLHKGM